MNEKNGFRQAFGFAVVLLIAGAVGFAAVSAEPTGEPVRMMFRVAAGKVLFDHKTHTVESGYGLECTTCHHHPEDTDEYTACGECHQMVEPGTMLPKCLDCHDEDEFEDLTIIKRGDAFHSQCIGCHEESGAGPVECNSCHVM